MHLLREQNDLLRDQIEAFRAQSHLRLQRLTALFRESGAIGGHCGISAENFRY